MILSANVLKQVVKTKPSGSATTKWSQVFGNVASKESLVTGATVRDMLSKRNYHIQQEPASTVIIRDIFTMLEHVKNVWTKITSKI